MAAELVCASRGKAQAELKKVGPFKSNVKVSKVFLQQQPLDDSLWVCS